MKKESNVSGKYYDLELSCGCLIGVKDNVYMPCTGKIYTPYKSIKGLKCKSDKEFDWINNKPMEKFPNEK